jgi:iron uptake system EfeUOB component EfeO/EfeM
MAPAPSHAVTAESPTARPPRVRPPRTRALVLVAIGVGLAAVALIAAALTPGGGSRPSRFSVASIAERGDPANRLSVRESKVFGSDINAKVYGTQIADQEDQGVNANGQMTSDLSPLPPAAFRGPIAAYRSYAERWAATLSSELPALRGALAAGDRARAEREWAVAYSDYLHLGAVYGLLPGTLDHQLDGMPENLGNTGLGSHFTGLHRIEMGLWTGASPRSLVPWASLLGRDVAKLREVLPGVQISPLDYATRAHEILEDAQRDLLSGTDVPWSGAGVLGTDAGLEATEEVIGTLAPLLQGRDNALAQVQSWLLQLQGVFATLRKAHHGTLPSLGQLSTSEHEQLNGTLAGTLGALSLVPGTLETKNIPTIPSIPTGAK